MKSGTKLIKLTINGDYCGLFTQEAYDLIKTNITDVQYKTEYVLLDNPVDVVDLTLVKKYLLILK